MQEEPVPIPKVYEENIFTFAQNDCTKSGMKFLVSVSRYEIDCYDWSIMRASTHAHTHKTP